MAPHRPFACAVVVLLLVTAPVFAYRREYVVTVNGERKAGAQVCFYGATSVTDAFALFFTAPRIGCLPADAVLDLPPGIFHAFARHADGFVSGYPDYFVHEGVDHGAAAPESRYHRLEIPMDRAAWLDVSDVLPRLARGQRIGVWLAPLPDKGGTFFPLVDGETSIMVPADRPFLPLIAAGGVPILTGTPLTLSPNQRRKLAPFAAPGDQTTDVIAWVKVDAASAAGIAGPLAPAEITLVSGDSVVHPVFPLAGGLDASHTLMIFKDVAPGPAELHIRGETWVHADLNITAAPAPTTIVRQPVVLIPGAAVEVTWNLDATWPAATECRAADEGGSQITATLDECVLATTECKTVAKRSVAFAPAGNLIVEGVPAGKYRVTLTPPFAKPVLMPAVLEAGTRTTVHAPFTPFRFFGTVRINDAPVQALLRFESGQAYADQSGKYSAALDADPLSNLIDVVLCATGETFRYVPRKSPAENVSYDIDIRRRELTVTVTDSRGRRVPGATVTFAPVKRVDPDGPAVYYTSEAVPTSADGTAKLTAIPADHSLVFCVRHDAYPSKCTSPYPAETLESGAVAIQLPAAGLRGRMLGHEGTALLARVDPAGRILEQVTVAADGAFRFQRPHAHGEHLVYASSRRPLTVLLPPLLPPQAAAEQAELRIPLPDAPVRSFTVTAPGMTAGSGFIGVWVGGRYIPFDLLLFHHDLRGKDPLLTRSRPTQIVEVAETAPITVAYVPEKPGAGGFVDPFIRPENAGIRRYPVTAGSVVLPEP